MENLPNKIPRNPAHAWLRVVMWILPTGFVWMSGMGVGHISRYFSLGWEERLSIWIVLSMGFVLGAGWYDSLLASEARKSPGDSYLWIIQFFLHQLYLVPLLTFFAVVAISLIT